MFLQSLFALDMSVMLFQLYGECKSSPHHLLTLTSFQTNMILFFMEHKRINSQLVFTAFFHTMKIKVAVSGCNAAKITQRNIVKCFISSESIQ